MNRPDYLKICNHINWLESQPVEFQKSPLGIRLKTILDKEKQCVCNFDNAPTHALHYSAAYWIHRNKQLYQHNPLVTKTPQYKEAMRIVSQYTQYNHEEDKEYGTRT